MAKRYSVGLYDQAGEYASEQVSTFAEALALVSKWSREFPHKVLCVANLDRCDYDTNGLTSDEKGAIDEASA